MMTDTKICSVEGCGKPTSKKAMCNTHYSRALRATKTEPCSVEGCDTRNYRKGLCTTHYRAGRSDLTKCSIEGCGKKTVSRGYCTNHYHRFMKHGDPLGGKARNGAALELIKKIAANPPQGCVFWPYGTLESGYGSLMYEGHRTTAHRLALTLYEGKTKLPPKSVHTRHLCGNGHHGCFNPRCLDWGTAKENAADTVAMERSLKGEKNRGAKLTEIQVKAIRKSPETDQALAYMFGVSRPAITLIRQRKNWAWLD